MGCANLQKSALTAAMVLNILPSMRLTTTHIEAALQAAQAPTPDVEEIDFTKICWTQLMRLDEEKLKGELPPAELSPPPSAP